MEWPFELKCVRLLRPEKLVNRWNLGYLSACLPISLYLYQSLPSPLSVASYFVRSLAAPVPLISWAAELAACLQTNGPTDRSGIG